LLLRLRKLVPSPRHFDQQKALLKTSARRDLQALLSVPAILRGLGHYAKLHATLARKHVMVL
jgi:hypothetical protein